MMQIESIVMQQKQKAIQSSLNQTSFKHVFNIIKKRQNQKPLILLSVIHISVLIYYYGVAYAMSEQGNGFGVNMMIAGGVQTVSFAFLTIFVTKMKRVKGVTIHYTLASILGLIFLIPVIHENFIITSGLLGLGRFFYTIAYTLLACMEIQSFNVQIQSTAVGSIQAFSVIGALLAPVVVDLANNMQIDSVSFILAISLLLGIWPNIFLKQTLPKIQNKDEQITKDQEKQTIDLLLNPKDKSLTASTTIDNSSQYGIN